MWSTRRRNRNTPLARAQVGEMVTQKAAQNLLRKKLHRTQKWALGQSEIDKQTAELLQLNRDGKQRHWNCDARIIRLDCDEYFVATAFKQEYRTN